MEVFYHNANEHIENEEADDQQEGDEVEQHPGVVVPHRLRRRERTVEERTFLQ